MLMPFTEILKGPNKGKYRSESGKIYTAKQVRAYYATEGWKRPPKKVNVRRHFRRTPQGMTKVSQHNRLIQGNYDYRKKHKEDREEDIEDLLERREKHEDERRHADIKRLLRRSGHYDDVKEIELKYDPKDPVQGWRSSMWLETGIYPKKGEAWEKLAKRVEQKEMEKYR